ncbi:hypothetical protein [Haloarcula litorea]|uniref:hypothetical protein n=1 Tax=Haloarcula litorea TaxID=3032579 RepID=UPI0023E80AC4|nr:hypothetical protein [Halomicroarcula sp. GDY20]
MSERPRHRLLAVGILLAVIGLALVWFGSLPPAPEAGVYPENSDVVGDYDTYVGDEVGLWGPVVSSDPIRIRVTASSGASVVLTVEGVDREVARGDVLSVYGTLRPDQQVEAIETVRKPQDSYWRTRVISALAGLWVLWRGLRAWRPSLARAVIERRPRPVTPLRDWMRRVDREGDDA